MSINHKAQTPTAYFVYVDGLSNPCPQQTQACIYELLLIIVNLMYYCYFQLTCRAQRVYTSLSMLSPHSARPVNFQTCGVALELSSLPSCTENAQVHSSQKTYIENAKVVPQNFCEHNNIKNVPQSSFTSIRLTYSRH